jgi:iron complex transport system substrate-binding protein
MLSAPAIAVCTVDDDAGVTIKLNSPAQRLVILAPDLVENVFAIGAGAKIVGVVSGSDYPEAARTLRTVGSYAGIDLERIVSLHPDLIVTWKYAFPRQLAALKQFGIPVYVAAPRKLEDIPRTLRNLGCLTGQQATANEVALKFERRINQLRVSSQKSAKVFFQIDRNALLTINQDSWISQVIELCGGKNIFADARVITPEVNRESIIVANPDVIFSLGNDDGWKRSWQQWTDISAVMRGRLYTVNPDLISRAGPRLVEGALLVCEGIAAAVVPREGSPQ